MVVTSCEFVLVVFGDLVLAWVCGVLCVWVVGFGVIWVFWCFGWVCPYWRLLSTLICCGFSACCVCLVDWLVVWVV